MKILVLGAGGIGGYFGVRLVQAGYDVSFLVRPARAERLRADGLRLTSPLGDATIEPQLFTALDAASPRFDLVILSCKAYDLDVAMDAIAPAMQAGARVLPLLNGRAHLARLDERFGRAAVLGGVAHISVTAMPDGEIRHLNTLQRIFAGPRDAATAQVARECLAPLANCGIDYTASEDIEASLWDKHIFLATLAAATCTMRASIGTILEAGGEGFILGLFDECLAIARADGHVPIPKAMSNFHAALTERGSALTASMLRDLERGGRIEADHIVGDLVRQAAAADIAAPNLNTALTHLRAYELRRDAGA